MRWLTTSLGFCALLGFVGVVRAAPQPLPPLWSADLTPPPPSLSSYSKPYVLTGNTLYLLDGSLLTRRSLQSGRIQWQTNLPLGDQRQTVLLLGKHLVVVQGRRILVLDPDIGRVTRTTTTHNATRSAIPFGDSVVLLGSTVALSFDPHNGETLWQSELPFPNSEVTDVWGTRALLQAEGSPNSLFAPSWFLDLRNGQTFYPQFLPLVQAGAASFVSVELSSSGTSDTDQRRDIYGLTLHEESYQPTLPTTAPPFNPQVLIGPRPGCQEYKSIAVTRPSLVSTNAGRFWFVSRDSCGAFVAGVRKAGNVDVLWRPLPLNQASQEEVFGKRAKLVSLRASPENLWTEQIGNFTYNINSSDYLYVFSRNDAHACREIELVFPPGKLKLNKEFTKFDFYPMSKALLMLTDAKLYVYYLSPGC